MAVYRKYWILFSFILSNISFFGQLDSLKNQLNIAKDSVAKADTYTEISYYYYPAQYDSALYYCNEATKLFDQYGSARDKAYSHSYLGVLYKKFDLFDSSITHFHESIFQHQIDSFSQGIAANYVNLGNVYTLKKENDIALKYFFDALVIFENLNDSLNQAIVNANIGELLIDEEDYQGARKHFDLSKSLDKYNGEQIGLIEYDLGLLELKLDQYDKALSHFRTSLNQWLNIERNIEVAKTYIKIGECHFEMNNSDSAVYYSQKGLSLADELTNYSAQFDALYQMALIHFKQHSYSSSIDYLLTAIDKQEYIENLKEKADAFYLLYRSYKATQNNNAAFKSLEKYVELTDSTNKINRLEVLAEYQTKLDVLSKQKRISELADSTKIAQLQNSNLKLKNKQQLLVNSKQKKWLIIISSIAGVIVLLLLLIFKQYQTKSRLNIQLNEALKEREVLIREVHHRVKNNLQIVSSLLNLQANTINEKNADEVLKLSQSRIDTMSLIHEKLYQSEKLSDIKFSEYINNLLKHLEHSFGAEQKHIKITSSLEEVPLHIDKLVPCGLILNELVTNAMKHAFSEQERGVIHVDCRPVNNNCILTISDNGKGLPEEFKIEKSKSLGLRLVTGLVKQLKGKLEQPPGEKTSFIISFPIQ